MDQQEPRPDADLGVEPTPTSTEAEAEVESEVGAEVESPEGHPPLDPEAQARAEGLVRQARLAQQRGQSDLVRKLLEEAESVCPDAELVIEAVGDDLVARSQFARAKTVFDRGRKRWPDNKTLERKYGEMVLKVDLKIDPFTASSDFETVASARNAVFYSLFFPGVGQIVMGQQILGGSMLAVWVLGWVITLTTPNGLGGLLQVMFGRSGDLNPQVLVGLAMIMFAHLWSVADASARSKRLQPRKTIDRPAPPVDKPFEM